MSDRSPAAWALPAVLAALPAFVIAQSSAPQPPPVYLAGTCTNCHGTQGRGAGSMPSLAGLPKPWLVERMKQFREGRRPATIMHEIARGYSDEQAALIADYFARQTATR